MFLLLLQLGCFSKLMNYSINACSGKTLDGEIFKEIDKFTLAATDDRRKNLEASSFIKPQNLINNILRCLLRNSFPTIRAMRAPCSREEETKVVIYLGNCSHCRSRISIRGFLINRDSRGKSLNKIYIGLIHLAQELSGICRERLDIASLAFRKDRVKGKGRLTGT